MEIDQFTFFSIESLNMNGFSGIPNERGIYIVVVPDAFELRFLDNTTAIQTFGGRSLIYRNEILNSKFHLSDMRILYIGKASGENNKLLQRICQFVKYGYHRANNHRGGRAIWQIANHKQLLLGYYVCEDAVTREHDFLKSYKEEYGTYPVANWVG